MSRVNWKQAFAEVALLLLGIGIAVAADSWRSDANDRATEQSYLVSLRADLETADSLIGEGLASLDDQLRHNRALLTLLARPGRVVATDSVAGMLRKAFLFTGLSRPIPTYRVLVSSGDLGLVQSVELKRRLAQLELTMEYVSISEQVARDQWTLDVSDFFVEDLNATAIYGPDSDLQLGPRYLDGYASNVLVVRPNLDLSAVWSQELANRIAIRNVTLEDTRLNSELAVESIHEIVELIDAVLLPVAR